jgi:hypothetical protein
MLVLVATTELQGITPGDYSWTVDGELVTPVAAECSSPGRCGCGRGFPGMASSRATTTAMVVDRPHISAEDLRDVARGFLERDGWLDLLRQSDEAEEADVIFEEIVDEHVEMIEQVCTSFEVGTVIERDGTLVRERALPTAA